MIRLFTTNEQSGVRITIDGQLLREFVEVVAASVHGAMTERQPIHLFLRDVSLIDDHGRTLLTNVAEEGVELSAAGVYSSYIVGEIRREVAARNKGLPPTGLPRSRTSHGQRTDGSRGPVPRTISGAKEEGI